MTFGEQNNEHESFAILDYAVKEAGINFIDTAELYPVPSKPETCGSTEDILGRWLAREGPEMRKKIVLASKVAGYSEGRGYLPANRKVPKQTEEAARLTRAQIFEACDASLRRLQTDYLDLYQLHWPDRYTPNFGELGYEQRKAREGDVPFAEQVQAMGDLIRMGKIRHWGLSNENAYGVTMMVQTALQLGVPPPVSIQNDFSLAHRSFESDGTWEACSPKAVPPAGISLLAYGPLCGGTLSGKYLKAEEKKTGTKRAREGEEGGEESKEAGELEEARHSKFAEFQPRYHAPRTMELAARLSEIAGQHNISPAQLALAWAASKEYMGSVIIGATSLSQLKENVGAFTTEFPADAIDQADQLHLEFERPFFNSDAVWGEPFDPSW
eukprot:CAMPEP_0181301598 /NCGR_PEP_ID=MMETSP1101-20121128/7511_1 /TAXON_ID=46948 /ORGANISM="Rhodomonas abbreviata, Strain Caron Lab Isolate" /LENGTH=383 /DNA_ID=CAMNT_0023406917 /DNA_START=128 /DNA_END=1280 /DNA_ORIENTATION=+